MKVLRTIGLRRFATAAPMIIGIAVLMAGFDPMALARQSDGTTGMLTAVTFLGVGVLALSVLVPKTAVSILAGVCFGTPVGCLLMLGIALGAASINYGFGRWWLGPGMERAEKHHRWGSRVVLLREVAKSANWRLHFLIRLTPVPTSVISYTMGASGGRFFPFLLGAAAGLLPQLLWIHAGAASTRGSASENPIPYWVGVFLSVSAAISVAFLVSRYAAQRLESQPVALRDGVHS